MKPVSKLLNFNIFKQYNISIEIVFLIENFLSAFEKLAVVVEDPEKTVLSSDSGMLIATGFAILNNEQIEDASADAYSTHSEATTSEPL